MLRFIVTKAVQSSEHDTENNGGRRGPNFFAWAGPLVVFVSAVSYFVYFYRFPSLRDFPWLNLPVVALGLLMSAIGLQRALVAPCRTVLPKVFGILAFFVSLTLTILFGTYIFFLSYQLPDIDGVIPIAQAAPDFALPDQHERIVELSDFRGKMIVVDFYRGHW